MSDADKLVSGDDYFGYGADQFTFSQKLIPGKFVSSENTICRGGIVQTRPGSQTLFTLPDGVLQGVTVFKPASGIPHIVAAVSGSVYVSQYPFTSYRQLENIQFGLTTPYVAWAVCLKSTDYTPEGELYFLDNPYSVLVMQDGATRAAFWDGTTDRHLNPTPSGGLITLPGFDETPMGLWMAWANNRLWVSRGNQVFASDIGNPLKFTEAQYLNEGRAFYLPGNCTGIAPTTDQQGIVCFSEQTGTFLQSSIQDRNQWLSTPDFQKDILPNIGCVAPRSIVSQYGFLWWYSSRGLINQDDALRANITSRLNVQDNPMVATKANMSFNLSGVCGAPYEAMLLMSVPWGDKLNRRTMVLDQAPQGELNSQVNSWAGFWTGWRPVEWAYGIVNGEERLFMGSVDYDGKNRVWEVGLSDRTDNGVPITCNLVTRQHTFDYRDEKTLNYVDAEACNIKDDVSLMICVSGVRGAWQAVGKKEIVATQGQIYSDEEYGEGAHELAGTSPQTRIIHSENYVKPSECNSQCIESDVFSGLIDRAFSVMFVWSGIIGIYAYRIFARSAENFVDGTCEEDEVGPKVLNEAGCGENEEFADGFPFAVYTSTKSYSQINPETALPVAFTATASSIISQKDADRKALAAARSIVLSEIE